MAGVREGTGEVGGGGSRGRGVGREVLVHHEDPETISRLSLFGRRVPGRGFCHFGRLYEQESHFATTSSTRSRADALRPAHASVGWGLRLPPLKIDERTPKVNG